MQMHAIFILKNSTKVWRERSASRQDEKTMTTEVKMDKTAAQRIQSNADTTSTNLEFKERAMRAAEKNDQRK